MDCILSYKTKMAFIMDFDGDKPELRILMAELNIESTTLFNPSNSEKKKLKMKETLKKEKELTSKRKTSNSRKSERH